MTASISLDGLCLALGSTVKDAVLIIDSGPSQVALVLDGNRLAGIVTDGDVRRAILNGASLSTPVDSIMCKDFFSLPLSSSNKEALELMRKESLRHVPILVEDGTLIRLSCLSDFLAKKTLQNPVLIMAGGEGRRLMPITKDRPKPMIRIGDRPLLEIIFQQCIDAGFCDFYFAVRYLKDQIMDYFSDGSKWGVSVKYLEEEQPLGTAGALSLLPEGISSPILVVNGDVLTRVDLRNLLQFHADNDSNATMCVREHETIVPFGVANLDNLNLIKIDEKPSMKTYVNAGIYMVGPELLDLVLDKTVLDMPQLLNLAVESGHMVTAFPVHEYWLDIGRPEALARARGDWL